jgi:hypothetical protein
MEQNQSDNQKPSDRAEEPELATASCSQLDTMRLNWIQSCKPDITWESGNGTVPDAWDVRFQVRRGLYDTVSNYSLRDAIDMAIDIQSSENVKRSDPANE